MNSDLDRAKELLLGGDSTCVLCKGGTVLKSTERGVKPLLLWLQEGLTFPEFCAADRVVGKAAALLYVLLGVDTVYAPVMSEAGIETLLQNGITPVCNHVVPEIRNRTDTGLCPMEEAVKDVTDPEAGRRALTQKIHQLAASQREKTQKHRE